MAKIYQIPNDDGTPGNWQYFSEKTGAIVDAGPDEALAQAMADDDGPTTTIAGALEGLPDDQETATEVESNDGLAEPDDSPAIPVRPTRTAGAKDPDGKPTLSPQFVRKIKEKLAAGTTTISVELERFLIARFGYATEELSEDDSDVEMVKLGWQLQWELWMAGKEPPAWMILAFGYSCITLRLIASAKKKEKEEHATTQPVSA
jgi:hypothetical protein